MKNGEGEGVSKIICGDVLEVLKTLESESIHCVVTSPPYWGLRKYIDDDSLEKKYEIGIENSPDEYVAKMGAVFREVRRVLRKDGTLFLNLGDSYFGSQGGMGADGKAYAGSKQATNAGSVGVPRVASYGTSGKAQEDLKGHDCLCENLC